MFARILCDLRSVADLGRALQGCLFQERNAMLVVDPSADFLRSSRPLLRCFLAGIQEFSVYGNCMKYTQGSVGSPRGTRLASAENPQSTGATERRVDRRTTGSHFLPMDCRCSWVITGIVRRWRPKDPRNFQPCPSHGPGLVHCQGQKRPLTRQNFPSWRDQARRLRLRQGQPRAPLFG